MSSRTKDAFTALGTALGLFLVPALFSPLGMAGFQWLQTAPRSSTIPVPAGVVDFGLQLGAFLVLFGLCLALAAPVVTVVCFIQRKRRLAAICFGMWMMSWAIWMAVPPGSTWESRRVALLRIAEKARPVTAALERYRADHGSYPESLAKLVPAYLPNEPRPDALGCPEYLYRLPDTARHLGFRGYELRLRTPSGGIDFDCFVYWPERKYPQRMYGGRVERIGDWAYVHE
jgi:hypothetical protein